MILRRILPCLLLLPLLAWPAAAGAQSKAGVTQADKTIDVIFSEVEKRLIGDYLRDLRGGDPGHTPGKEKGKGKGRDKVKGGGKGLPPGLAKRQTLPPGLARQVQRNGTLPPVLETRDLPPDLARRLPPLAPGTQRVVVGDDIVLVREGTRLVLDVLKDVLSGL